MGNGGENSLIEAGGRTEIRVGPAGWSSISRRELTDIAAEGKGDAALSTAVGGRELAYIHPDQPLETALRYVYEEPLIPVVSRANIRKLEGVITQENVLNRYRMFDDKED